MCFASRIVSNFRIKLTFIFLINFIQKYFDSEKPDLVILDDGHQHLKIVADFKILLFNALLPMSSYRVFPCGYLREGLSAIDSADAVLLTNCDKISFEKVEVLQKKLSKFSNKEIPFFRTRHRAVGLYDGNYKARFKLEELDCKDVICVAGIANQEAFFASL